MTEVIWEGRNRGYRCRVSPWDDDHIGIGVGVNFDSCTMALPHADALSLAQALIEHCAPEPEGEWGPLIPWYGHGCPLDVWEYDNARLIMSDKNGNLFFSKQADGDQWCHGEDVSHVIAYRVRKRPPEPVEEWVRRYIDIDGTLFYKEVRLIDGKPTGDVRPVEGE